MAGACRKDPVVIPPNKALRPDVYRRGPLTGAASAGNRGTDIMTKTGLFAAAAAALVLAGATAARADELIASYNAYIGQDDLYNSYNERLTQPWQVIRQDRANVHRFGIRQPGDEVDDFFGSTRNRELAEAMIQRGAIGAQAAQLLLNGDVRINVQVWRGAGGDYLNINVD